MENEFSYKKIDCVTKLRCNKDILNQWKKDRYNIFKNVRNENILNDNFWENIISYNKICGCNMGNGNCKAFIEKKSCSGCYCLSNLFYNGEIQFDNFDILDKAYQIYQVKNYELNTYFTSNLPNMYGKSILKKLSNMDACEKSASKDIIETTFMKCDNFLGIEQYIITSCFLENELNKVNIPCFPTFKWIFCCGEDVNIIERVPSMGIGTLSNVINKYGTFVFKDILLQLISTMHCLNLYSFIHGQASLNCLGFDEVKCDYIYENVRIKSDITINYIPCIFSSFTISNQNRNLRLYANDDIFNIDMSRNIDIKPFLNLNKSKTCPSLKSDDCLYTNNYLNIRNIKYKIGNATNIFTACTKNLGIPLFHSSFDLYCIWLDLMFVPEFYNFIVNDKIFNEIWINMWNVNEYQLVINFIKTNTNKNIRKFLSNLYLRCDCIDYVWNALRAKLKSH